MKGERLYRLVRSGGNLRRHVNLLTAWRRRQSAALINGRVSAVTDLASTQYWQKIGARP